MSESIKKKISPQEVRQRLESAVEELDVRRTREINRMIEVREARSATLKRGYDRRVAKRGGSDPAADRLARRIEHNRTTIEELLPLSIASRQAPPDVPKGSAVIHGAVLSEEHRGVAKVTVTLVDKTGRSVPDTPEIATGADGYFEITVPESLLDRDLFVEVRDGDDKRRLTDTPFRLNAGEVRFIASRPVGIERRTGEVIAERLRETRERANDLNPRSPTTPMQRKRPRRPCGRG